MEQTWQELMVLAPAQARSCVMIVFGNMTEGTETLESQSIVRGVGGTHQFMMWNDSKATSDQCPAIDSSGIMCTKRKKTAELRCVTRTHYNLADVMDN